VAVAVAGRAGVVACTEGEGWVITLAVVVAGTTVAVAVTVGGIAVVVGGTAVAVTVGGRAVAVAVAAAVAAAVGGIAVAVAVGGGGGTIDSLVIVNSLRRLPSGSWIVCASMIRPVCGT
jgi:hypothetical protein